MENETTIDEIVSDIVKPRYTLARTEAKKMWKDTAESKIPVILKDIVKQLDIVIRPAKLTIDGITRMDQSGVCMMMYNSAQPVCRQRFTVAHELGHIALEHISPLESSQQISSLSREKEANAFAGSLLVPSEDLKKFTQNNDKTLQEVAQRYWISKDVATIAIDQNHLLNRIVSLPSSFDVK